MQLSFYFFKIHFNIILLSPAYVFREMLLLHVFPPKPLRISALSCKPPCVVLVEGHAGSPDVSFGVAFLKTATTSETTHNEATPPNV
jgi:hypothetical protein